jgi:iron complex outermembrane recepter protein
MNTKILIFLIFTLMLPPVLYSQTISGTITEKETGKPLPYAAVLLSPANKSAVTDMNGKFTMTAKPGRYVLKVTYLGYKKYENEVELFSNQSATISVILEREPYFLSGVEIVETKSSNMIVSTHHLNMDQIQTMGTGEVGEVLRSIPNVGGVRRGGAVLDPVVRGFKFSQLSVYIDGLFSIEGGCPNRMDPTVSRVDAHDIERIEVVKGPYALQYGPNFGGAIRLVSHNPAFFESEKPEFKLNAFAEITPNLGMREHIRMDAGNKSTSLMVFGGRTDLGNFTDGNGDLVKMQVMKYNFGGKILHRFNEKNMLKVTYNNLQGRDVLFAALPMDERSDNTWFTHADYLGVLPFGSNKTYSLSAYYANVEHVMDNFARPISDTVAAVSTVIAETMGGKFRGAWTLTQNQELITGIDYQRILKDGQRVRNMIAQPPTPAGTIPRAIDQLWSNAAINNTGLFAEWNLNKGVQKAFAAFRLDMNSAKSDDIVVMHPMLGEIYRFAADSISSSFLNISASGGYSYELSENINVSVAVGRGTRSPDMLERYIILLPVGYDNYDYLGNPSLEPETNNEADLTLRYQSYRFGSAELTGFYSYVENFITGQRIPPSQQKPLTNGVLGVKQYMNSGNAVFTGFEFAYSTPVHRMVVFSANAAYTNGTMKEIFKPIIDPSQPAGQQVIGDTLLLNDPLSEIPPLEANVNLGINLFDRKLSLLLNTRIIASQNRVSQAFYEAETPSATLLNVSARYHLSEKIHISAGVHNILNEYYYEHLNRRMIGTSQKIFEPGRRFFINVSIKI